MAANLARIPTTGPGTDFTTPPPSMMAAAMPSAPPDMGPAPAPLVSRIPTTGEQNIAHDQARLQKVQWHQDNPWHTQPTYDANGVMTNPGNHPGKLGAIGHAFATLGNIAGNIVAPGVMANIPGTQMAMRQEEGQLAHRVQQEQTAEGENQEREAQTNKANVETGLEPGKTASSEALQGAQTENIQNPKEQWSPVPGAVGNNGEPLEYNHTTGAYRAAPGVPGASLTATDKTAKDQDPKQVAFKSLVDGGMTPVQAWDRVREKVGGEGGGGVGTWQLAEDKDGKPILFNSKTAQTREAPEGMAKAGSHAKTEAADQPAQAALGYANDYLKRGVFTGSGDEALQEKFFELAKPSVGFRMTQPQIDMLQKSRGWMNSVAAHMRHATVGTWFDNGQRKEIVDTMQQLHDAKMNAAHGGSAAGGTAQPSNEPKVLKFNAATGRLE